jgi:hypothetical protein
MPSRKSESGEARIVAGVAGQDLAVPSKAVAASETTVIKGTTVSEGAALVETTSLVESANGGH